MTRDELFQVVKRVVETTLPDLDPAEIQPNRSLADLGANSIDRLDVTMGSLESLDLHVSMTEFAGVANLQGLVDILYRHTQEQKQA
jgi:polyketide biosynthesis acyl carrier protein